MSEESSVPRSGFGCSQLFPWNNIAQTTATHDSMSDIYIVCSGPSVKKIKKIFSQRRLVY